jgi:hypothetical protein
MFPDLPVLPDHKERRARRQKKAQPVHPEYLAPKGQRASRAARHPLNPLRSADQDARIRVGVYLAGRTDKRKGCITMHPFLLNAFVPNQYFENYKRTANHI